MTICFSIGCSATSKKPACTGTVSYKEGVITRAAGGTLFLDWIGLDWIGDLNPVFHYFPVEEAMCRAKDKQEVAASLLYIVRQSLNRRLKTMDAQQALSQWCSICCISHVPVIAVNS